MSTVATNTAENADNATSHAIVEVRSFGVDRLAMSP
jgi:hypothetical protein